MERKTTGQIFVPCGTPLVFHNHSDDVSWCFTYCCCPDRKSPIHVNSSGRTCVVFVCNNHVINNMFSTIFVYSVLLSMSFFTRQWYKPRLSKALILLLYMVRLMSRHTGRCLQFTTFFLWNTSLPLTLVLCWYNQRLYYCFPNYSYTFLLIAVLVIKRQL